MRSLPTPYSLFPIYCLLLTVGSWQSAVGNGQNTTIKCDAKPYKGKEVAVIVFDDNITETENELAKTSINDTGYFEISFNISKTEHVFLKCENATADLHAEPGKTYDAIMFAKDSTRFVNANTEQLVSLAIRKTDSLEINYLIADFNNRFDIFWENNYKFFVADQFAYEKIDSFKVALKKQYSSVNSSYFKNLVNYKIAALEDAASENRKKLFTDYVNAKPLLYDSYEYINFVSKFYTPVIRSMMLKENYINALSQKVDFKNFVKLFKSEKYLTNDTLRELIAIKALYISYSYPLYTNGNVLHILETASKEALNVENRKIAGNIVKKIGKLNIGAPAPPFQLPDKNDKLIRLMDFKGKHVYIDFWATWCVPCLAEMKLIPELKKEYGSQIEFVSISIDDNIDLMKQFLKKNPQYNWTFLYTGSKGKTKGDYMVYSVPAYYLVNSFGNLQQSPAEKPSGEIERVFDEIVNKKK